ncbi:MAG: hypothetical protein GY704_14220, partial [Phycisphaeraceae bacterium]|nr:hypothetical protein [Phycisphaeraceae bacterium]
GSRLYDDESKVAWCGIAAPFDLLTAMGVTSCFVEFIGAMLSSTGVVGEFLEAAEHDGFAGDTCGYHRAVMGATNPAEADEGTIRKLYAESIGRNACHGSDSAENAAIEIKYFFADSDLYPVDREKVLASGE